MGTNKPAYSLSAYQCSVTLHYNPNVHVESIELALGDVRERG